jgi:metallo-beta-lactamase class B
MKAHHARVGAIVAVFFACFSSIGVSAQQPPKRDFEAEIQKAIGSAKTAAAFDFQGTLVRTCLLPQSGGENFTDNVPGYVTNPASAPARDTWYAEPAKVFDNLYFVGGKLHSAWAFTTKDGIILIDTIYPYNSEELVIGGMQKIGSEEHQVCSHFSRACRSHRRRGAAADPIQGARGDGGSGLGSRRKISEPLQNHGS